MFHTLTVGLPDTTLYFMLIGFAIVDVKDHPMRWLLLKVPGQLSIVTEPPDTSSQTVHQYATPRCFPMVEIGVYSPGFSVTLSLGLLIRFVTIIGHHRPGARRQSRGMVSPEKKPGIPPPNGSVIRVGAFDEDIAHHAFRADRVLAECDSDEQLVSVGWDGDGPVHCDGLAVANRHAAHLTI